MEVTVKGTGVIYAEPVEYRLVIVIENVEPTKNVSQLLETVINRYRQVLTVLERDSFRTVTRSVSLTPEYTWSGSRKVFVGYVFRIVVDAYTDNLEAVEQALPRLAQIATDISLSYVYNTSNIYKLALEKALADAIRKLRLIARVLNVSKYRIVSISETSYYTVPPLYSAESLPATIKMPIYPSPTKVYAAVTARGLVCFRSQQVVGQQVS